tara:strand:+ start:151 stop:645 length:495 start_codon:yes stop_codon:yes gene_type:complete
MMTAEEKYKIGKKMMLEACDENGWGDPFSYARAKEIDIAIQLGHKVSDTLSGADGYDEDGGCEYKSTIGKNINGTYNGISVQPTWSEQVEYLKNEKIGKYKNHYIARFDKGNIVEVWKLDGETVLNILLPKLENKYPTILEKKDPRLGASLTQKDIYDYGIQIQ